MTHPIRIAAVVVTFNRLRQLQTTVQKSLQAGVDWLLVVNNASTDGTSEWLSDQLDSRLIVMTLPRNVGGAGGFHHGFDHVVKHLSADWLVCYDDDAYPDEGSLETFRKMVIPQQVAGVAAAVYLPDGRISEMNRPSRDPFHSLGSFMRTALQRRSGFHVSDKEYAQSELLTIDFSSFVGCFLRTDAIRKHLGLPRKELFIYADDIMYTHGIGRSGLQHRFAPQVRFVHDCGTLVKQMDVYKPMWKVYYTYRNRLELYRQVTGPIFFYPIGLVKLLSWMFQVKHYSEKRIYMKLTFRAWLDGMNQNFSLRHDSVLIMSQESVCEAKN